MLKTAILLVVLQLVIGANLPDTFKRCRLKDPNNSSCFKVAISDAVQKMGTTGIPSLNVEPLQPMVVKVVKIDQGGEGPVTVKLQFTNMMIYGIPQSSVVSFGLDNYEIKAESLTPEFKIDADYTLEGQLLLLPIRGTGKCTITMESLVTYHHIKAKPVTRNGEIYWDLQKYEINMRAKHMSLSFRNLFNGDKTLGETMNEVLNENWELLFKELRPSFEKAFGDVFLEYAKGIFDKVPTSNIFLD